MSWVVALTGGIGSGKSAAAAEFERLGATVVDTDAIAHELTQPGGSAVAAVRKLFGPESIAASGAMDRDWVRARVFADPAARRALEALLHPMIREESRRRIEAARGPYVVHVIPLLVESRYDRANLDRVLVVDAPEEVQIERVGRRSGLAEAEVRAILAAQASRAERLGAAHDVIDNRGTIEALRQQVVALHRRYLDYSKAART